MPVEAMKVRVEAARVPNLGRENANSVEVVRVQIEAARF